LLKPVLVCDDDPDLVRLVSGVLKAEGFSVVDASSFRDAVDQAHLHSLTAAIVDQMLPDGDGVELCRRLREDNGTLPVLVLSGVPDEQAKIRALDAGADDYITKPFGCGELMARLRAVLRRAEPPPPEPVLAVDGLEIDLAHTPFAWTTWKFT